MVDSDDSDYEMVVLTSALMLAIISILYWYFSRTKQDTSSLSEEEKQRLAEERRMKGCKVALFVDNSNLFMTGMRFYARRLNLMVPLDPSFRIKYDSLCRRLLKGRKLDFGKLYVGSKPARYDVLWDKIREGNLFVSISERAHSGEEKEVDSNLVLDAAKLISSDFNKTPGTVILVSGDRDFRPLVLEMLRKKWKVELYGFDECISGKFKELEINEKLFTITYLDRIFDGEPVWHFVNRLSSDPPMQDSTMIVTFEDHFNFKTIKENLRELANNLTEMLKVPCELHAIFTNDNMEVSEIYVTGVVREPKDSKKSNINFFKIWRENKADISPLFLKIGSILRMDEYFPAESVEVRDDDVEENQDEEDSFEVWCKNRLRSQRHKSLAGDEKGEFVCGKEPGIRSTEVQTDIRGEQ